MADEGEGTAKAMRGRPRDSETETRIREATWALLAEKGYEALTIEAIADLAQCARSTLYRRWPNKPALVGAMLERTSRHFEPSVDPDASARETLLALILKMRDLMRPPRGPALLGLFLHARNHADLREVLDQYSRTEAERYYALLAQLGGPEACAKSIGLAFASLIGSMLFFAMPPNPELGDEEAARLVDNALLLLTKMVLPG